MFKKNHILGLALIGICLAMLVACLWPLDFRPVNNVRWLPGNNGLHFEGPNGSSRDNAGGIVFTPDPLTHPDTTAFRRGEISIELWLRPDREPNGGVPRILTFYDAENSEKLIIGQWRSAILARISPPNYRNRKPYREIGARNTLPSGKANFVTFTSSNEETSLYLDGKPVRRAKGFQLFGENDTLAGYKAFLGNSVDIDSPWAGDIFGLAIYGRALTEAEVLQSYRQWTGNARASGADKSGLVARYVFDGDSGSRIPNTVGAFNSLYIPKDLIFSQKVLAKTNFYRINGSDVILNIVGFIPFGGVLALFLRSAFKMPTRRAIVLTVLAGAMLSSSIEILQAYLPTRDSSQTDLFCNILGTMVGSAILWRGTKGAQGYEAIFFILFP